jgi:hypothetical protein
MGNYNSVLKVSFENIQNMQNSDNVLILSTLSENNQDCLIKGTLDISHEEVTINNLIKTNNFYKIIIIYGENDHDSSVLDKYHQLKKLGFKKIYMYLGGIFEWLLLQDIYSCDKFPTFNNGILENKLICSLDYKPKASTIF